MKIPEIQYLILGSFLQYMLNDNRIYVFGVSEMSLGEVIENATSLA